ncbi:MAG: MATE family efflux transporter [Burkholderiales bacterium]|nr:MATE family efflux transporter [Burkholderiales bacterium]
MTVTVPRRPTVRIASLAWPILVGQLATIANGVIDTAMTSRYSATDLAALSISVSIYLCVFVGANGVLQALSPIIGQLFGAKRFDEIGAEVKQGAWLALFLTIAGGLLLLFPQPLLSFAQASPELNAKAAFYLRALAFALPAALAFRVYGALNNAVARPKAVMLIQVAALALKVPLNTLFIFGGLGLPAFGGPGCAIATAITAWVSLAAGFILLRRSPFYRVFGIFGTGFVLPRWSAQRALIILGIPMGLSYLIEVSAFAFMALFIARLGTDMVAGHQITANFVTVLYMMPLSLASATGTLVAHAVGARNPQEARRIAQAGIRFAALLAACVGLIVWLAREGIVRAYTPDPAVIAVALPLYMFIGMYHFFDALQASAAFVLRAYKIAVVPTIIYAVMLWGVGLGGGYIFGFRVFDWIPLYATGAAGFWLGNTASVALAGISLLWYLHLIQNNKRQ